MKKGWETKKLGDVCSIGDGNYSSKYPKASEFVPKGVPFLTATNLKNGTIVPDGIRYISKEQHLELTKGHVRKGDLVVVVRGSSTGNNSIVPKEYEGSNLNSQLAFLRASDNRIIPEYLFITFNSPDVQKVVLNAISGAAQPQLPNNRLLNIEIPLPPLPEQKLIVSILDEAFAAVAKAKANAEQNLKNAKELFESYLKEVFENKGEGWEEKSLGEIADVEYGYTDKSTEEGDYRYIRITDIDKNGELILDDRKYIKHSKEAEGFLIQDNDLLMARTGATFAKVLLYNGDEPSVFASYLIRIKFNEKIENAFYWYFTKTKYYWEQANSLQSGAAQPHFNGAAVKQVIFSYPKSVKEQKVLIKKFETLSIETKQLEAIYRKKIDDLEELKKSILQKAFAGELQTNAIIA